MWGMMERSARSTTSRPRLDHRFTLRERLRGYRLPVGVNPSLRHYQRAWLATDVTAGVTVGALTIPSALGYAEVAGLPPVFGLYAAMVPMVGVRLLVAAGRVIWCSGHGVFAAMIGATLAPLAAGSPERAVALAPVLALLVGGLFLVFGLALVGFLAKILSRPLLSGFMTGLAIAILVGQLPKLLGISVDADTTIPKLVETIRELGDTRLWSLVLGGTTVVLSLVIGRLQPRLPAAVLLLLVGAGLVAFFAWQQHGVAVVGDIPTGLPPLDVPDVTWNDVGHLFPGALALAVLGFADAVLQSRPTPSRPATRSTPTATWWGSAWPTWPARSPAATPSAPVPPLRGRAGGWRPQFARTHRGCRRHRLGVAGVRTGDREHARARPRRGRHRRCAAPHELGEIRQLWPHRRPEVVVAVAALGGCRGDGRARRCGDRPRLVARELHAPGGVAPRRRPRPPARPARVGRRPPGAVPVPGLLIYRFDAPLFFATRRSSATGCCPGACVQPAPRWLLVHASAIGELDVTATDTLRRSLQPTSTSRASPSLSPANMPGYATPSASRPPSCCPGRCTPPSAKQSTPSVPTWAPPCRRPAERASLVRQ